MYVGACETGTCRDDPIPPGYYWYDSIDAESYPDPETVDTLRETYTSLLETAFAGAYRVLKTVHHEGQLIGNAPARDWILFQVIKPIPRWPAGTQWGLPTVAPNGAATNEGDTVQKPPPEKGVFEGETLGVPTWALVAGGIVALGVVVYAASR